MMSLTKSKTAELENKLNTYESQLKDLHLNGIRSAKSDVVKTFLELEERVYNKAIGDQMKSFDTEHTPVEHVGQYLKKITRFFHKDEFDNPKPDTKLTREFVNRLQMRLKHLNTHMGKLFSRDKEDPDDKKASIQSEL